MADNPAMVAWQQALQGQVPTGAAAMPFGSAANGKNAVEQFLLGLGNATLNMPQTAVAGYKNLFGLPFGLGAKPAVPITAPTLPATPNPINAAVTRPTIATKVGMGGGPQELNFPAGPELLAPPTLPAPPQMAIPGGGNYASTKAFADQAKPGPIDQESLDKAHVANVLGGLAGGAGSVSATEPGSFARALAMWGAGGAKGASSSASQTLEAKTNKDKENQAFYTNRAQIEQSIETAKAHQAQTAAQVAFQNAKLTYDTNIQNMNNQFEFNNKKLQLEQPQIKQDANGISITQLDPATRQWKMRYVPTKPVYENLEKMEGTFKALGMNTDAAKASNIQFIADQYKADPLGGREVMKGLAVRDLVNNGAGSAVFGQAFQKAVTAAKTELEAIPEIKAKPELYMNELNARIAAKILNMPEVSSNMNWAVRGVAHSPYARVLAGSK